MIEYIIGAISGILIPIILFILKKLYYLNHVISEIKIELKYIKEDVSEIKHYILRRRK